MQYLKPTDIPPLWESCCTLAKTRNAEFQPHWKTPAHNIHKWPELFWAVQDLSAPLQLSAQIPEDPHASISFCFKTPRRGQLKHLKPQFGHFNKWSQSSRKWANAHRLSVLLVMLMLPENQSGFTAKPQATNRRGSAGQRESTVFLSTAAGSYNQDYLIHWCHASNGITLYQPNGTMGL